MTQTAVRFSKRAVLDHIQECIDAKVARYDFNTHTGYAQVVGKPIDVIVEYGEFSALIDLREQIEYGL